MTIDPDIAINVRGLWKKYIIGGEKKKYLTFRDAISNAFKNPFSRTDTGSEEFWALKDVSFDIYKGEVVGIIGRNGAGKSTLLKILSQITTPTEGEIDIYGRVGSLLEVGTGFHPELTGRENIFLSGSILGMRKREIEDRFDNIVKFAEIEKFIETPVKRYSSGMYVRLAFAVAAHMDTEILLVDEVLAVGDAQFQKKCMGKMGDVATKEGRTVLFVSHNMGAMSSLCERGLLLEQGKLIFSGNIADAISRYTGDSQFDDITTWVGNEGDENVRLCKTWILSLNDDALFITSTEIEVGIEIKVLKPIDGLITGFTLYSSFGYELAYSLYDDELDPPSESVLPGRYIFKFVIPENTLSVGAYQIIFDVGIHMKKRIIISDRCIKFRLENYNGLGRRFPVPEVRSRAGLFRPNWFRSITFSK